MRSNRFLIVCVMVFALMLSLAACGGSSDSASSDSAAATQAAQPGTAETIIPSPDPAATVDALIGSWVGVASADQFANITKNGDAYQYEDNDGKYAGTFANGKLTVKVNDTETADSFVDAKTGHMFLIYQGQPTEFSKK